MAAQRTVTINADGIAEREVMYVRYELNQQTDVEGQPTGTTRGGKIYVKVKSNDDGNTDLLEWMCDTYMSKSDQDGQRPAQQPLDHRQLIRTFQVWGWSPVRNSGLKPFSLSSLNPSHLTIYILYT